MEAAKANGHTLVLWTSSRRDRAMDILREHDLRRHFRACICREDYDPGDRGAPKDIRRIKGDILIDDDPDAVRYVRSIGGKAFLVRSFRKGMLIDRKELAELALALGIRRATTSK
jgi:hypothetical protein